MNSKRTVMSEQFQMYVAELNSKIVAATEAMKEVNRVKNLAGLPTIIRTDDTEYEFDISLSENYDKLAEMFEMIKSSDLISEFGETGIPTDRAFGWSHSGCSF